MSTATHTDKLGQTLEVGDIIALATAHWQSFGLVLELRSGSWKGETVPKLKVQWVGVNDTGVRSGVYTVHEINRVVKLEPMVLHHAPGELAKVLLERHEKLTTKSVFSLV